MTLVACLQSIHMIVSLETPVLGSMTPPASVSCRGISGLRWHISQLLWPECTDAQKWLLSCCRPASECSTPLITLSANDSHWRLRMAAQSDGSVPAKGCPRACGSVVLHTCVSRHTQSPNGWVEEGLRMQSRGDEGH